MLCLDFGTCVKSTPPFYYPNLKRPDPLVLEKLTNTPLLLFCEALASREPKDTTFLLYLDNINVEILILYPVALISNIYLLTAESLTGEPNEKEPTFNDEPSPDNE